MATGWTSRLHSAYPPDFNFFIARVIGTFYTARLKLHDVIPSKERPPPPPDTNRDNATQDSTQPQPAEHPYAPIGPTKPDTTQHRTPVSTPRLPDAALPAPFKRTLGEYPLRLRAPAALLTTRARRSKPQWGRDTGCAFAVNNVSTDPRSRKQVMADDRIGWGAAERAEIANHALNGSWETIDRSKVPSYRSLVRLIWVYRRKRSGALKARLCVPGCAQIHGVDYDQSFCATMRPTALRALAAIAASANMRMRRWDFVAAYLQGDLEQNEVVYLHAPPGYATLGADGRPRVCRVVKPIYGMAHAGRRWQRSPFPWLLIRRISVILRV
eukprot:967282-Pleurochrysis_carterae.AAC.1